jgi:hypothetical protein
MQPNISFGRHFTRTLSIQVESKPIIDCLADLFRQIGIDIAGSVGAVANSRGSTYQSVLPPSHAGGDPFGGSIVIPSTDRPEDLYSRASRHNRETMVIRMEKIFDEVESRLSNSSSGEDDMEDYNLDTLSELEDPFERNLKHLSKPVVIGDAIPPPLNTPSIVQHVCASSPFLFYVSKSFAFSISLYIYYI